MNERDKAVHRFVRDWYQVGSTPRDPLQAIKDIARLYGLAVAYLDRKAIDSYVHDRLNRTLTDGEWDRVKGFGDEYDEFVDATPGPTGNDVPNEFIRHWLDECGIPGPDNEKWSSG